MTGYMKGVLGFTLKENWHIKETAREGVDMMGFVVHQSGKVTIRDRDFIRARRMILRRLAGTAFTRTQAARTASYKGFFKHSDSRRAYMEYFLAEVFEYAAEIIGTIARQENRRKKGELSYVYE